MSSTSSHHGSAHSHNDSNEGHDQTDFNWTLILWTLPLGALILVAFTLVCLFFYRGYLEDEFRLKQSLFQTAELNALKLADSEVLTQFKLLNADPGKIRIPIVNAMERVVQENQNSTGRDWAPLTDIYLEGAAFAVKASASAGEAPVQSDIIIIEDAIKGSSAPAPESGHDHSTHDHSSHDHTAPGHKH